MEPVLPNAPDHSLSVVIFFVQNFPYGKERDLAPLNTRWVPSGGNRRIVPQLSSSPFIGRFSRTKVSEDVRGMGDILAEWSIGASMIDRVNA